MTLLTTRHKASHILYLYGRTDDTFFRTGINAPFPKILEEHLRKQSHYENVFLVSARYGLAAADDTARATYREICNEGVAAAVGLTAVAWFRGGLQVRACRRMIL